MTSSAVYPGNAGQSLSNVNISTPVEGQVLKWSASRSAWVNNNDNGLITCVTDSSLKGDGTGINPLGINQVSTTASMTGAGTIASPLDIAYGYATNSNSGWGLSTPASATGTNNVWLGFSSGASQTGSRNTIVGSASSAGTTSNNSVIVGAQSTSTGGGTVNIFGQGVTAGASADSTFIGTSVRTASGSQNQLIIGDQAGSTNNNGQYDIIMGWQAGNNLTEAKVGGQGQNIVIGALAQNTGAHGASTVMGGCCVIGSTSGVIGTNILSSNIVGLGSTSSASQQCLFGNGITGGNFAGAIAIGNGANVKEINCLHLGGAAPSNLLTSTGANAGGASALPATPAGYLVVYLNNNGTRFKIPYYAN